MCINMATLICTILYLCIYVVRGEGQRNESIAFVKVNLKTSPYIGMSIYIISVSSIKILYSRVDCFARFIPESNLLLLGGLIIGFVFSKIQNFHSSEIFKIKSGMFFYLLLPPIILESSFSIYHKTFASNLAGVFVFAIFATLLNFFAIACCLKLLLYFHMFELISEEEITANTIWIFASLIVAVDPVAVLGIFQEIHVDNNLYYLVFGESLLNDGVSVVLYDVMIEMSSYETVTTVDIIRAIVAFVLVGIGGGLIGGIMSSVTCIVTRYTVKTPLVEPVVVIVFGYLAYLIANSISWSGIISIIVYGVIQAAYGFQNVTSKSLILIKRLSKILSSLSESVIFLNLGVTVTSQYINFKSAFVLWSTFLCLYMRFIFTLSLSGIINFFRFNIRTIQWNEQFIIAYGGLRGGIAFCLSELVEKEVMANKHIISEATVFIVVFTILVMGFTMKPLVKMLNIEIAKPDELCLFVQITESAIEHLLAGVEEMIGMRGRNTFHEIFSNINELYIRPILQRDKRGRNEKIMKVYEKLNLTMHMATTAAGTPMSEYYLQKLKPQLRLYMHENRRDFSVPRGLSALNNLTIEETADVSLQSRIAETRRLSINKGFFMSPRSRSIDHSTFAHRMTAILDRKKRSLAVANARDNALNRLSRTSRITNDSETEVLNMWRNKPSA